MRQQRRGDQAGRQKGGCQFTHAILLKKRAIPSQTKMTSA